MLPSREREALALPICICGAPGACGKPPVMPHERCPRPEPDSRGNSDMRACIDQKEATGHSVVIAGGGPTGLMLAGELALAGVDVAIVERRASQELVGSRAGGLHSR